MESSDTSDFIRRGLRSPLLIPTLVSGSPSSTASLSSADVSLLSVQSDLAGSEWSDGKELPPQTHVTGFQLPLVLAPWQVVECEMVVRRYLHDTVQGGWECRWVYNGMDTECQIEWTGHAAVDVEAAVSNIIQSFFPTDIVVSHTTVVPVLVPHSDGGYTSDTGSDLYDSGTSSGGYVSAESQSVMSVDTSDSIPNLSGESEDEADYSSGGGFSEEE